MFIRRHLNIFLELVREYALVVDVTLVRLNQNKAESIRIMQRWLEAIKNEMEPVPQIYAVINSSMVPNQIWHIHSHIGHPGVKWMSYFIRKIATSTMKEDVRSTIRSCPECLSIDPSPVRWEKGKLETTNAWQRLGKDITTYGDAH